MPDGDLVVVLPGIMGSTLRADGKMIWAPSGGAILRAIRTFGGSIKRHTLPPDIGDKAADDGVEPVALMPDLHALPGIWTPVKGYDRLVSHLQDVGFRRNLLPVPYDWRLSNRYNGERLAGIVEPALHEWRKESGDKDAKLVFVCHSMGGLVARWYIEQCDGHELTRKLITLGTPYRGAAKALDQLVNGVRRGIGPLAVDLTTFARSLPSLHQLLPEYACIANGDKPLLKTTETTLPALSKQAVADAMLFHEQLRKSETARPGSLRSTHAIIGTKQPTSTTATITPHSVVLADTFGNRDLYGDGTVPAVGAVRQDVALDANVLRRVADKHGNLQANAAAFAEIDGILQDIPLGPIRAAAVEPHVRCPELILSGESLKVSVDLGVGKAGAMLVGLVHELGRERQARQLGMPAGHGEVEFEGLDPGAYTVTVQGVTPAVAVAPVTSEVIVWPTEATAEPE